MLQTLKKKLDKSGRPTEAFPIVCTSYEMVHREANGLRHFNWGFIIIVSNAHYLLSRVTNHV